MALEVALDIGIGIIMLQKLFISNRELIYSTFNFY